jgi:arginine/lysine/ornithine decarboxylase
MHIHLQSLNKKIVDYLRFTREFNQRFPGFDTDVHGLVEDDANGPDGSRRYYVDCVRA